MSVESRIEVVNHHGWQKAFVLQKNIIHIGSDERNDIVLHDDHAHDVAPRHAQLIPSPINRQGLRLINLSDEAIQLWPHPESEPRTVLPRDSAEILSGDCAQIGNFKLKFHGGDARSELLAIRVSLESTELTLEQPIHGYVTVYHRGDEAGVQLKIEVEGIDPVNVDIDPGPVLFPDTEKEVPFVIHHSGREFPPAGEHPVTFHVAAPDIYPNERASTVQMINVEPLYRHALKMLPLERLA